MTLCRHLYEIIDVFKNEWLPEYSDNRTPDFVTVTTPGLIYTGGTKLAEHGGFAHEDRNVALLVWHKSFSPRIIGDDVETRQIAPTILKALGLDPKSLQAVVAEKTDALPGLESLTANPQ